MKTFRIFVSSTFSDLEAERDAMQKQVFPYLRDLCASHGARFQAVDLRWGVSEEAGLDQQTMRICLDEIKRCQAVTPRPNFIVLLGDRYGWRPLPEQIPVPLFESILEKVKAGPEAEARQATLKQWYWRDDNRVSPQYLLQAREGEFRNGNRWAEAERQLRETLEQAIRDLSLTPEERFRFTASATEQEIALGAFVQEAPARVFGFFRTIKRAAGDNPHGQFWDVKGHEIDDDAQARLQRLKARLRDLLKDNIKEYSARWTGTGITTDHTDQLCADIRERLARVILEELAGYEQINPIERERRDQADFGRERARNFVGRSDILDRIDAYVMSSSRSSLAIIGESGVGKTSLMAKHAELAREKHGDTVVISRFIGATMDSSNVRLLLRGLCRELAREYGASESNIPETYEELTVAFRNCLGNASAAKPLIVLIDALDQLSGLNLALSFPWIPAVLPPYSRLIVTALPALRPALARVVELENLVDLLPMSPGEGAVLLDLWLAEARHNLQPIQRQTVLESFAKYPYPLYLRLVFEQVRHWASYWDNLKLGADTAAVIADLLQQLSDESNHGPVLVSRSLASLVAARNGLAEDELVDLLSADDEVMAEFRRRSPHSPAVTALPPIIWARLYYDLVPYLTSRSTDGATLLTFFHRQFSEAVTRVYLPGEAGQERHRALADYFSRQQDYQDGASRQHPHMRKLSELPYQQTGAAMWPELRTTLLDFPFLEAKTRAVGPDPLIEDFERALSTRRKQLSEDEKGYDDTLRSVQAAVELSANVLRSHPEQLASHLIGRLAASDDASIISLVHRAQPGQSSLWLKPLTPSLRPSGGPLVRILGGHAAVIWKVVVSQSGQFAVSAGNDNTVVVWNVASGVELHRLTGFAEPVFSAAIEPEETYFVCASGSSLFKVDLIRGIRLRECHPDRGWIRAVAIHPTNRTVIFGTDQVGLLQWDPATNEVVQCVQEPYAHISSIALLEYGNQAAAGADTRTYLPPGAVIVWDLPSGRRKKIWWLKGGGVKDLVLTPDQKSVIIAGDYELTQWDIEAGTLQQAFTGHSQWINGVTVTHDGKWMMSGSADHTIKVWNLSTGKQRATLTGHHGTVRSVAAIPGGNRFLSSSDDQTVRLWDLDRIEHSAWLRPHDGRVNVLVITRDGGYVVSASDDKTLKRWHIETGKPVCSYKGHNSEVWSVAVTADGERMLSLQNGAMVIVWDLETGAEVNRLHLVPRSAFGAKRLVLSPDDKHFFCGEELFEIDTGRVAFALPEYECAVVAFLDGGSKVLFYGNGSPLRVWDLEANRELRRFSRGESVISLMPDNQMVAGGYDGVLRVWNLRNCSILSEWRGHRGEIAGVAATADGKWAASVSGDGDFKLWDLANGRDVATFTAESPLSACALTADHQQAIAGDWLGNLHFLRLLQS